jgi:hypothetical protein
MDVDWNKPPYIRIPTPMLSKATEYRSIRIASQFNSIVLSRLKVTALTNSKIMTLTKSIILRLELNQKRLLYLKTVRKYQILGSAKDLT